MITNVDEFAAYWSNAANFRYVDVSGIELTGNVLPVRELRGSGSHEIRGEDVAFLAESIAERTRGITVEHSYESTDGVHDVSHVIDMSQNAPIPTSVGKKISYDDVVMISSSINALNDLTQHARPATEDDDIISACPIPTFSPHEGYTFEVDNVYPSNWIKSLYSTLGCDFSGLHTQIDRSLSYSNLRHLFATIGKYNMIAIDSHRFLIRAGERNGNPWIFDNWIGSYSNFDEGYEGYGDQTVAYSGQKDMAITGPNVIRCSGTESFLASEVDNPNWYAYLFQTRQAEVEESKITFELERYGNSALGMLAMGHHRVYEHGMHPCDCAAAYIFAEMDFRTRTDGIGFA